MPPSAAPQLNFLGSSLSLADAAADWLLAQANFDFAQSLIVVPTARAGERLRASLEARGILSAQVFTGGECMRRLLDCDTVASPIVARRLMAAAIRKLREEGRCIALFPNGDAGSVSDIGILKTADLILDLRHTLAEEGLSIQSGTAGLAKLPEFSEQARWQDILDIENLYLELLKEAGLDDDDRTLLGLLDADSFETSPVAVVFAFNPDPPPYLLKLLEKRHSPVFVLVSAPSNMADHFDAWGRPSPAYWSDPSQAAIRLEPFKENVIVTATSADLARHLFETFDEQAALGILHDDLAAEFESLCALEGISSYNPNGVPASQTGVGALLEIFPRFIKSSSFSDTQTLLRHFDFRQWLRSEWNKCLPDYAFSWRGILLELDEFAGERLPGTLDAALAQTEQASQGLQFALSKLQEFRKSVASIAKSDLPKFFVEFFAASRLAYSADPKQLEIAARKLFFDLLGSLEGQWSVFSNALDLIQSVATQFRGERIYYAKPDGAREYLGWLELSYDASPVLQLYGLIEGVAPSSAHSGAFLPESARRGLHMRTGEHRYARDAFLFWHMLEARREMGAVTIGFPQRSSGGDALKPSRFFYHCPNSELSARALHLFVRKSELAERPPWELVWKLAPPVSKAGAKIDKLRVTAFREYLACPYRFYLRHILNMERYEPDRLEMDERSFGNLIHNTLEVFGRSTSKASADALAIADCCEEQLMLQVEKIYGCKSYRNLAVELQVESALQRLRAFAEIQAKEAEAGWQILAVEQKFEVPFIIDGVPVKISGTIDRIERRTDPANSRAEWRVLDYKTYDRSDSAHEPRNDHIAKIRKAEPPPFAIIDEERYWKNLQLPLYIYALKKSLASMLPVSPAADDIVSTAYIILPKAVADTKLHPWALDRLEQASAYECAEAILANVRKGEFWPPASPGYDDFAEILSFPDASQAVEEPTQ